MAGKRSRELFKSASALMPGGVNSPVRAFGPEGPPYIVSGAGATITDADGNKYIDFVGSWGPLILGHAHPEVVEAVREAAGRGLSFGACHEGEILLAEAIRRAMPGLRKIRLVSSGTEAAMSAARLARAATGRPGIIKFKGCYHGHADSFLIAAGSGALTHGTPSSPGVTQGAANDTLLADYNRPESVEAVFEANPGRVAAIFVEPVAGNMGVVPPAPGFLEALRKICDREGALLVFDEVITGFRVAMGGATERYGVTPDLTVLGKIVGGGMPLAAYGGSEELMDQLSPVGKVYQAGTLSGNPLACAAGLATLRILEREKPYERLEALSRMIESGTAANMLQAPCAWTQNRVSSMSTLFMGVKQMSGMSDADGCDTGLYMRYQRKMLDRGIYLAPAQYEASFLSTAHSDADVGVFLAAQNEVISELAKGNRQ